PRELLEERRGRPLASELRLERPPERLLPVIGRRAGAAEVEVLEDLQILRDGELPVHEQVESVPGFVTLHAPVLPRRIPSRRANSESSSRRIFRARKSRLMTVPIGIPSMAAMSL